MLEEWAVIATYDRLAGALVERWRGVAGTLLLDIPPALRKDEARVREIVQALQQS
jgi:hypothetical protein